MLRIGISTPVFWMTNIGLGLLLRSHGFLNFYSAGELMAPSVYAARRRRSSDLMYCSVEFSSGGKTYYYISNDPSITEGDIVEVPVGKDNTISTGKVVDVEYFSRDDAPLEPEKVKLIIRIIDNE